MANTFEHYLAKGFDEKAARYFASEKKRIISVVPNDDYTLTIEFDNGENRLLDVRSYLEKGTVFETFLDIDNFKRVYVDKQHCIAWDIDPTVDSDLVWNNKVDLCPDSCYIDSLPLK